MLTLGHRRSKDTGPYDRVPVTLPSHEVVTLVMTERWASILEQFAEYCREHTTLDEIRTTEDAPGDPPCQCCGTRRAKVVWGCMHSFCAACTTASMPWCPVCGAAQCELYGIKQ